MEGLEPLAVFWTGWGIHIMVVVSFTVQVTLLLLGDIRRRKDSAWLKAVIWSAYMLADTTAIYALGHMSVLLRWSPEHQGQLMALWAPLLLVHLGGQDNITAYAIEDNRLWLRHLQTFMLQVAAAGYVLYVSSIHPSKVRSAAILMFVVGVLKYLERIWALMRANSCCSSSLSATSYSSKVVCRKNNDHQLTFTAVREAIQHSKWGRLKFADYDIVEILVMADSLLDVPKQMFEGPTSYVQIGSVDTNKFRSGTIMLKVVELQLWMMYDLLYTKAAVVHTWYGLCSRVLISLPFTIAALALFCSSSLAPYKRADVVVTSVLLVGAVVLETMSVLRAIFSKWTAILLFTRGWNIIGTVLAVVEAVIAGAMARLVRSDLYWSGCIRQHNLFELMRHHSKYSRGRKMAKRMGLEDWWDSNVYSWSTEVPELTKVFVIIKVLELVSSTPGTGGDITRSRGLNAIRRTIKDNSLFTWIWMEELRLEESILVWHIATHVYIMWKQDRLIYSSFVILKATKALADYMFYLLASRPYMLPYPVSRLAYLQLCSGPAADFMSCTSANMLLHAILRQKKDLMQGIPLQPDEGMGGRQRNDDGGTTVPRLQPSMNSTLDKGCQLAAKLIHITANKDMVYTGHGEDMVTEDAQTFSEEVIINMLFEVWTEMLCYTANLCNEKSNAKHLTDGGDFMTIMSLLMIYLKNGFFRDPGTTGTPAGPSSSEGARARATDIDTDDVV